MDEYVDKGDPRALARMLRLGATTAEELKQILIQQLHRPVQFDLESLAADAACTLRGLSAEQGLLIRSFADLLYHPHPPIELLLMTKDFAKACRGRSESDLPPEIASLLYIASIVAARLRCGRRISDLDDASLCRGIRWLMMQSWLDEPMRLLLADGLRRLDVEGVGANGG